MGREKISRNSWWERASGRAALAGRKRGHGRRKGTEAVRLKCYRERQQRSRGFAFASPIDERNILLEHREVAEPDLVNLGLAGMGDLLPRHMRGPLCPTEKAAQFRVN
jgi:hypothetical protein